MSRCQNVPQITIRRQTYTEHHSQCRNDFALELCRSHGRERLDTSAFSGTLFGGRAATSCAGTQLPLFSIFADGATVEHVHNKNSDMKAGSG